MPMTTDGVTRLLDKWQNGDGSALDQAMALVYGRLRSMAGRELGRERPGHTLQPTALVHEAYLRLAPKSGFPVESTSHFIGVAARLMRQVLVQHARVRNAHKRGGAAIRVPLDQVEPLPANAPSELLHLDEALVALAEQDCQKARIVEMRYFAGLTNEEIAAEMEWSLSTVGREMRLALAWIRQRISAASRWAA
jgi:RNA polymerase sigma-70 factor (ECF subfamily)